MIYFDNRYYHKDKNGGLYLKYEEIEELTEALIVDYDKTLLTDPHAIEYDDFLESYLGLDLSYQDIYTPSNDEIILGCSVFNKQSIPVFNRDNMRKEFIEFNPGTVVLDNSLVDGERKIQENITGLHEGGHFWLHKDQFTETEGQMSLLKNPGIICCRKEDLVGDERLKKLPLRTSEMWREWQATVFAVTLALPKKSLDIAVKEQFDQFGVDTGVLITNADYDTYFLSEEIIPNNLRIKYNMSKESIRYRLQKKGFYMTKKEYEEAHKNHQMTFFDLIK